MRAKLRIYWDTLRVGADGVSLHLNTCPRSYGGEAAGTHNAYAPLGDHVGPDQWGSFGQAGDYTADRWPTGCAHCGAPVPTDARDDYGRGLLPGTEGAWWVRQVFEQRLYDAPGGVPAPGDIFYREHADPTRCWDWDNCTGPHLIVVCPNGREWDVDSRASNCDMREERTHRCWVRHGSPEDGNVHVDKNGRTCGAGAGSILAGSYHGHLVHGVFCP